MIEMHEIGGIIVSIPFVRLGSDRKDNFIFVSRRINLVVEFKFVGSRVMAG